MPPERTIINDAPAGQIRLLLWNKLLRDVTPTDLFRGDLIEARNADRLDFTGAPYADLSGDMYQVQCRSGLNLQANTVGGVEAGLLRAELYNRPAGNGLKYDPKNIGLGGSPLAQSDLRPFLRKGNAVTLVLEHRPGGAGASMNDRVFRTLWIGVLDSIVPSGQALRAERVILTARGMMSLVPYEDTFIPGYSFEDIREAGFTPGGQSSRSQVRSRWIVQHILERLINEEELSWSSAESFINFLADDGREWVYWPGSFAASPFYTLARIAHNDAAFLFESRYTPQLVYRSRSRRLQSPRLLVTDTYRGLPGDIAIWSATDMNWVSDVGSRFNEFQATVGSYIFDRYKEDTEGDGNTYYGFNALDRALFRRTSVLNEESSGLVIDSNDISREFTARFQEPDTPFNIYGLHPDGHQAFRRRPSVVGAYKYEVYDVFGRGVGEGFPSVRMHTSSTPGLEVVKISECADGVRFKVRNHTRTAVVLEFASFKGLMVGFEQNLGRQYRKKDYASIRDTGLRRYNFTPLFRDEPSADSWFEYMKARYGEGLSLTAGGFLRLDRRDHAYALAFVGVGDTVRVKSSGKRGGPVGGGDHLYLVTSVSLSYTRTPRSGKVDVQYQLLSDGTEADSRAVEDNSFKVDSMISDYDNDLLALDSVGGVSLEANEEGPGGVG